MYIHGGPLSSFILEILLSIAFSSSSSFGHTQPNNYGGGYHHHSSPSAPTDTAHIRPPHARSSVGGSNNNNNNDNHHHYVPHKQQAGAVGAGATAGDVKLTRDKNLLHDKEHLKEDMGDWLFKDGKEMTAEEMEFHYFKTHDFDNNSMLDGLEILQAISHILPMTEVETDITSTGGGGGSPGSHNHHDDPGVRTPLTEAKRAEMIKQREEDFNYYIDLIDKVLSEDDLNRDGYLSYMEYSIGRRREEELQNQIHMQNQNSRKL